jgi:AraC-like DNA-binding protein
LEKASEIGGTWRENQYPGAACDVQSHLYSLSFSPKTDWSKRYAEAPEIAGTYKFLQDIYKMIGLEMPEIRITLPVARPEDAKKLALYQQVYGQQVSFGTQQAEFWFDEWVLNVPIPSADLMTFNVYAGKCQAELQRLEETAEQPSLIQRVQDYLELQRGLLPTMAETAQALNLPERTLRHQLQQLNSSYKQIREQLMKDRALHLMEYQEYSIEMIAELLG